MGRDTNEQVKLSPGVESSQLDQEMVAEAQKQAEVSKRKNREQLAGPWCTY